MLVHSWRTALWNLLAHLLEDFSLLFLLLMLYASRLLQIFQFFFMILLQWATSVDINEAWSLLRRCWSYLTYNATFGSLGRMSIVKIWSLWQNFDKLLLWLIKLTIVVGCPLADAKRPFLLIEAALMLGIDCLVHWFVDRQFCRCNISMTLLRWFLLWVTLLFYGYFIFTLWGIG